MVSINTRDAMGIRMLQDEEVEVSNTKDSISRVKWPYRGSFLVAPLGGAVDLQRGPCPGGGWQAGEEDGLSGCAGGRKADGRLASDAGEEAAAVEGRGVHG